MDERVGRRLASRLHDDGALLAAAARLPCAAPHGGRQQRRRQATGTPWLKQQAGGLAGSLPAPSRLPAAACNPELRHQPAAPAWAIQAQLRVCAHAAWSTAVDGRCCWAGLHTAGGAAAGNAWCCRGRSWWAACMCWKRECLRLALPKTCSHRVSRGFRVTHQCDAISVSLSSITARQPSRAPLLPTDFGLIPRALHLRPRHQPAP
jgi:hypothetical protein